MPPNNQQTAGQYCLYLRKSRADLEMEARGEMETLARHEKILLDLAKRLNLNIGAIYKEIVSGDSIASRPVAQKVLDEVEDGKWAGVLVVEVERLARGDTIDQGIIAKTFKRNNTKIVTPLKIYDPSNEYDEEYFEFSLFMSRREYKTINRRIQRGRVASAKEGRYLGSVAPYGYDRVKIEGDKGYTLQPNAETGVVQSIYRWYLAGDGCSAIARHLDQMHIKPRRGDKWSKASILDILRNPIYIGKIRWSYWVKNPNAAPGVDSRVKNDSYVLVDGLHPAIISEDDFRRAQELIRQNRKKPLRPDQSLKNPLSGLGICGKCGSKLTRLGPNAHCPYGTIRCSNRYCDNVAAPLDLVEREVIDQLGTALSSYTVDLTPPPAEAVDLAAAALRDIRAEQDKIKKQVVNCYDLLEQGIYTTDIFLQRQSVLQERDAELTAAAEKIEREQSAATAAADQARAIPEMMSLLGGYWGLSDAADRNALLKIMMEHFEYIKTAPNRRGQRDNRNFTVTVFPRLPG